MTVYQSRKSPYWQYDFVYKGERFHGSTGVTTKRAAEEKERQLRQEASLGLLGQVARMTLDQAAGRYWAEVGEGRGDAADVERRIARLLDLIGKTTPIGDIDQATVSEAIQRRRRMTFKKGKGDGAKTYAVSDSTVNRDVIETLRPILRRAKTHWNRKGKPHGLPEIDWGELRLREPTGQSRLYSTAERVAWIAKAEAEDMGLGVDMILTYGLRLGELRFPLDALSLSDPDDATLTLQKGRKKDVILHLPLTRAHARSLAARVSRASAAGLDTVWYRQVGKQLVALTYYEIEGRISRAADAAGISGGRRIHGGRHHAASSILKKTRNMKAVQSLLGHATINSSQRYAHVLTADLREALDEEIPRNNPGLRKPKRRKSK